MNKLQIQNAPAQNANALIARVHVPKANAQAVSAKWNAKVIIPAKICQAMPEVIQQ